MRYSLLITFLFFIEICISQLFIHKDFILDKQNFHKKKIISPNYNVDEEKLGVNIYSSETGNKIKNFGYGIYHLKQQAFYDKPLVFFNSNYSKIIAVDVDGLSGKRRVDIYSSDNLSKESELIISDVNNNPPYFFKIISNIEQNCFTLYYDENLFLINTENKTCISYTFNSVVKDSELKSVFQINSNKCLIVETDVMHNISFSIYDFNKKNQNLFATNIPYPSRGFKIDVVDDYIYINKNDGNLEKYDNNGVLIEKYPIENGKVFVSDGKLLHFFPINKNILITYNLSTQIDKINSLVTPWNNNIVKNAFLHNSDTIIFQDISNKIYSINIQENTNNPSLVYTRPSKLDEFASNVKKLGSNSINFNKELIFDNYNYRHTSIKMDPTEEYYVNSLNGIGYYKDFVFFDADFTFSNLESSQYYGLSSFNKRENLCLGLVKNECYDCMYYQGNNYIEKLEEIYSLGFNRDSFSLYATSYKNGNIIVTKKNIPKKYEVQNNESIETFENRNIRLGNGIVALKVKSTFTNKYDLIIDGFEIKSPIYINLKSISNSFCPPDFFQFNDDQKKNWDVYQVFQNSKFIYVFLKVINEGLVTVVFSKLNGKIKFFNLSKRIDVSGIMTKDPKSHKSEAYAPRLHFLPKSNLFVSTATEIFSNLWDVDIPIKLNFYDENINCIKSLIINDMQVVTNVQENNSFFIVTGHTMSKGYLGFSNPCILVLDKKNYKVVSTSIIPMKNGKIEHCYIDNENVLTLFIAARDGIGTKLKFSDFKNNYKIIKDELGANGTFINNLFTEKLIVIK
jgi:hypothetical protein